MVIPLISATYPILDSPPSRLGSLACNLNFSYPSAMPQNHLLSQLTPCTSKTHNYSPLMSKSLSNRIHGVCWKLFFLSPVYCAKAERPVLHITNCEWCGWEERGVVGCSILIILGQTRVPFCLQLGLSIGVSHSLHLPWDHPFSCLLHHQLGTQSTPTTFLDMKGSSQTISTRLLRGSLPALCVPSPKSTPLRRTASNASSWIPP